MADVKLTLVVACALVDADKRVLLARRAKTSPGCGNFPAARSSRASGRRSR
jgi:8-oxo-dGTP diphosphatase